MVNYILCLMLFCIGLYAVARRRNLIKIIIGLGIMEYAVNIFFVLIGYRSGARAPILAHDQAITRMVDPLAQAVVMTTIVVGLCLMMVVIAIAVRIYQRYGTFDITKIRRLHG